MASFSTLLHLEGKVYIVVTCYYSFRQHIDSRGRPRSQVLKGPIYVERQAVEDIDDIVAWSASDWKTLSGKIVFSRADSEAALKHVWFTHAYGTGYKGEFTRVCGQ